MTHQEVGSGLDVYPLFQYFKLARSNDDIVPITHLEKFMQAPRAILQLLTLLLICSMLIGQCSSAEMSAGNVFENKAAEIDDRPVYLGVIYTEAFRGLFITKVFPNSPASAAGLHVGDVLLEANGARLIMGSQLRARLATGHPGSTIELRVRKSNGQERVITAELEAMPETAAVY